MLAIDCITGVLSKCTTGRVTTHQPPLSGKPISSSSVTTHVPIHLWMDRHMGWVFRIVVAGEWWPCLMASVAPWPRDWNRRSGRPCHIWLQMYLNSIYNKLYTGLANAYHRAQNRQASSTLVGTATSITGKGTWWWWWWWPFYRQNKLMDFFSNIWDHVTVAACASAAVRIHSYHLKEPRLWSHLIACL